jgi:hypothetical protein
MVRLAGVTLQGRMHLDESNRDSEDRVAEFLQDITNIRGPNEIETLRRSTGAEYGAGDYNGKARLDHETGVDKHDGEGPPIEGNAGDQRNEGPEHPDGHRG